MSTKVTIEGKKSWDFNASKKYLRDVGKVIQPRDCIERHPRVVSSVHQAVPVTKRPRPTNIGLPIGRGSLLASAMLRPTGLSRRFSRDGAVTMI